MRLANRTNTMARRVWRWVLLACWLVLAADVPVGAAVSDKATWAEALSAARASYIRSLGKTAPAEVASSFEPVDTGPMAGKAPARRVEVNVAGLDTIRLVTICEKGQGNCHIWGEPVLIAADGAKTKLGSLKPASVSVGWGQLTKDQNWQKHPLQVGDRKFSHGLWVHGDSELIYKLAGKYVRLEAWVGIDKDRAAGMARFKVLSGKDPEPPAVWKEIAKRYPRESNWITGPGARQLANWFQNRPDASQEQSMIDGVLGAAGAGGKSLRGELKALAEAKAPAGDARWLDLYARSCLFRDVAQRIALAGPGATAEALKDLDALAAAKTPIDDARWASLGARAAMHLELEKQYEALKHDLANRKTHAKRASETLRADALVQAGDRDPLDIVLRRTAALAADLKRSAGQAALADLEKQLVELTRQAAKVSVDDAEARHALFVRASQLRRRIAFANPLLDFDRIVFIKRHKAIYRHMCDQFYGMAQRPGGGLCILNDAFGDSPTVTDVLAGSTVSNGRLKGQRLWGGPDRKWNIRFDGMGNQSGEVTEGGSFLSPDLSFDGRQILFAYVECRGDRRHRHHTDPNKGHWAPGRCYHVFKANVDGSDLVQLTDGTWNDFDPAWLPNGRIVFNSERRGGYLRCGRVCPTYTLYDMAPDGSDINCLSFHETNEWNPSVTNDGRIVYTRWDYVDRFGCTAHHPWITTLDGADSRAVHGNFAPRNARPDMEVDIRAIPNSVKFVATAAPHHGQAFGSLVLVNPNVPDDDAMGPVRRITPEVGFPESQGGSQCYGMAYPLSEDYYICVYDVGAELRKGGWNFGIYLVDSFGNKELLYRDPKIACMSPIPLRPRPTPPVTLSMDPAKIAARGPAYPGKPGEATIAVVNTYDGKRPWPEGTRINSLRVFKLLPMSVPSGRPPFNTGKRIAQAGDSVVPVRHLLGTVPVEADGSAHFTVPANVSLFFQALDANGLAVQSMRSATYFHEGERILCAGCHEPKNQTPPQAESLPTAMRREPSKITPDVDGSNPFSYPRLVQPVLDRNCVPCHTKKENASKAPNLGREPMKNKWFASYNSLIDKYAFTNYGNNLYTTPGKFGAQASKLYEMLAKGHKKVKLSSEDMHRITLWLDCASMFYGVYEAEGGAAQLRGEIAHPTLE